MDFLGDDTAIYSKPIGGNRNIYPVKPIYAFIFFYKSCIYILGSLNIQLE